MTEPNRPAYYAACYCEENVWRLCQDALVEGAGARYAVFVSNEARRCPMWSQRAAPVATRPVVWDYHVVLLTLGERALVWDADSRLAFPSPAERWLAGTFPFDAALEPGLRPRFRVVEAGEFVRTFASDRSHMRSDEGEWQAPPPPFPPIRTADATMNLWRFVDTGGAFVGELFDGVEPLARWIARGALRRP